MQTKSNGNTSLTHVDTARDLIWEQYDTSLLIALMIHANEELQMRSLQAFSNLLESHNQIQSNSIEVLRNVVKVLGASNNPNNVLCAMRILTVVVREGK